MRTHCALALFTMTFYGCCKSLPCVPASVCACVYVCAYLLMRLSNAFYEYFLAVCRFTASNSPALCGPLMPDKLLMLMLLQP